MSTPAGSTVTAQGTAIINGVSVPITFSFVMPAVQATTTVSFLTADSKSTIDTSQPTS
jgi:hypothetical protein